MTSIPQIDELLRLAREWIVEAPHDEHCFTNDPNPDACRCVCGKDYLIDAIDDAFIETEIASVSPPVVHAAEPVAWAVRQYLRDGTPVLRLPLLTSKHEADRYLAANPEVELVPLFASPQGDGHSVGHACDVLRDLARKDVEAASVYRGQEGSESLMADYMEHATSLRYAANRLASFEALSASSALLPQGVPASPLSGVTEEQVEGWRDGATAPKDGKSYWLAFGDNEDDALTCEGRWQHGSWVIAATFYDPARVPPYTFRELRAYGKEPTHWRPLPNPPALGHPGSNAGGADER